jgi:hypothetical protein
MWHHAVLSSEFESEGACWADVDGDGELEVVAGDSWWRPEATGQATRFRTVPWSHLPDWPHDPKDDPHPHLRRGAGPPRYRASTYDWPVDLTGNGLPDLLAIGMHKDPIRWFENPGPETSGAPWPSHTVAEGGVYESAVFARLRPDMPASLVTVPRKPLVAWYEPGDDPTRPWHEHVVGDRGGDWHGLGVGDIDGDGYAEIITRDGYYRQGPDPRRPWHWRPMRELADGQVADGLRAGFIFETLGGPDAPFFSASPHGRGVWGWRLADGQNGAVTYERVTLDDEVSQTHAIRLVRGEHAGGWRLYTGKRWQAHGAEGDVDPAGTPHTLLLSGDAQLTTTERTVISSTAGVGISIAVTGEPLSQRVAVSNKLGVHVLTEQTGDPHVGKRD